ncbi:hypothetical protein EVAR_24595_1 [Eumeta japonica]|uniref:Uncharacterized protein n=1 Tax=Eumeta variegata TaxID=151549 RepID=A0A4C1W4C6_EUMVA|nr:hypothetical protein EVAR_24595_1 [Eumeta japonica]
MTKPVTNGLVACYPKHEACGTIWAKNSVVNSLVNNIEPSTSGLEKLHPNRRATATRRELSFIDVPKLGEGSACNRAPDPEVRAALRLALLVASGASFNSRTSVVLYIPNVLSTRRFRNVMV